MIITHLAVSGVGRFRTRHVVKGLGPGLNLLCAPNEHGKSTLFRALHACLFLRHGSTTEDIRKLATLGAQLPAAIEAGFEQNGAHYTIQKSFLQSRASRLFKDGQLVAEGRPADEAVWRILGVAESGRNVDEATFGLLWVRQGVSFDPVEPNESARSALNRLIEAEVGQVLGGARGERVRKSIGDQLAGEETDRGHPRAGGEWKRAIDAAAKARDDLAEANKTLQQLEADLDVLARLLKRQRDLEDPEAMATIHADIDRARQELDAAVRAQSAAEIAGSEEQRAELEHERALKRHQELTAIDARIAATRKRIADLEAEQAEFLEIYRAETDAVANGEARLAKAVAALKEADLACDRIERLAIAAAGAIETAALRARLNEARATHERRAALAESLARDGLSAELMRSIEGAAQELELRRQRRAAKAPQVVVRLEGDGGLRVRLQGEVIDGDRTLAVTRPVSIAIEGIASVDVTPAAIEDGEEVNRAEAALDAALRKAGVASLAEARARRTRTEMMEAERRDLDATLRVLAPPVEGQDGLAVLERRLAAADASLSGLSAEEIRTATEQPDSFAVEREGAQRHRALCREAQADAQTVLLTARSAKAATEVRLAACRNELARQQATLQDDLRAGPDAERPDRLAALAAAIDAAARTLSAAKEKAAASRAALPSDEERKALAVRVKRLDEAIRNRDAERQQLREDIASMRATIAASGGQGLGERAAELAERLAVAERDQQRIEDRLKALRLLRDTIDACRNAARDAYLAPIKRSMQPFLQALFPGAEAQFDEGFVVESLNRSGSEPEPFDYLSHGTREQIAVMVRLALGGLLAARGQPAPVLLDDALVFSDDERIERMFDVLTQAAEKHQVIVLTCRSRAFQSFGGRRLTVMRDDGR